VLPFGDDRNLVVIEFVFVEAGKRLQVALLGGRPRGFLFDECDQIDSPGFGKGSMDPLQVVGKENVRVKLSRHGNDGGRRVVSRLGWLKVGNAPAAQQTPDVALMATGSEREEHERLCELPNMVNEIAPALLKLAWPEGQTLLLASDGAWRHLPPSVTSTIYAARPKLHDFVLTLAAVILAGPADDNLTLMALRPCQSPNT
jgi:hypothetical protein